MAALVLVSAGQATFALYYDKIQIGKQLDQVQTLQQKTEAVRRALEKKAADQHHQNESLEQQLQQKTQETEQQKLQIQELQARKAQRDAQKLAVTAVAHAQEPAAGFSVAGGGIDCNNQSTAKAFMYCHESGNDPASRNGGGCYGLGQDCNGLVENQCGANYACQDAFFTDYMQRRYGSWEAARAFWLARTPINGRDVGNWW